MLDVCIRPNKFFADLIDILMMCKMEAELVMTTQVVLELFFLECEGHNKDIRDHFIQKVQKIKKKVNIFHCDE